MAVTYRNTRSGRVETRTESDPDLDTHPRWERQGAPAAPAEPGEPPAGNASAEAWRAYALTQGVSAEDAAGATRDELRERFGG